MTAIGILFSPSSKRRLEWIFGPGVARTTVGISIGTASRRGAFPVGKPWKQSLWQEKAVLLSTGDELSSKAMNGSGPRPSSSIFRSEQSAELNACSLGFLFP